MKKIFKYGLDRLTSGLALALARGDIKGQLVPEMMAKVTASCSTVRRIAAGREIVYGINTGFGSLCNKIISKEDIHKLQYNILKSHSAGVGNDIPTEIAKLMLILKVQALAQGYSGVSPATLQRMLWHIEEDFIPTVPVQGSVGASGDLAPLAHLFLPLIGLGSVQVEGAVIDTKKLFQMHGVKPIELGPKEGLALINGTQFMAAFGIEIIEALHNCLSTADILGAMAIESLLGSLKPFNAKLQLLRPFKGNCHVALRIYSLLKESQIMQSHANCSRVQDPYSLRCIPQVHGASRSAWLHLKEIIEIEINSVTDNPIIFSVDLTISGGNFHGQPIALPMDYAGMASAELGNISDRRIYLLLEGKTEGLPQLLMHDTGLNSGFMLPQYTSAALVSENKSLCFPASVDSIPTSLGQEDHVSMGSISGRKTLQIISNLENILAIELLCAAQAFDFRKPLKSGLVLEACHEFIRGQIDHAEHDRIFALDIQKAHQIIKNKSLINITKEYGDFKSEYDHLFEIY